MRKSGKLVREAGAMVDLEDVSTTATTIIATAVGVADISATATSCATTTSATVGPAVERKVARATVPFDGETVEAYHTHVCAVIGDAVRAAFGGINCSWCTDLIVEYCPPAIVWSIEAFVHSPCHGTPWVKQNCFTGQPCGDCQSFSSTWMRPRELLFHVLRWLSYDDERVETLHAIMMMDGWGDVMDARSSRLPVVPFGICLVEPTVSYIQAQPLTSRAEKLLYTDLFRQAEFGSLGLSQTHGGRSFDELVMANALSATAINRLLLGMVTHLVASNPHVPCSVTWNSSVFVKFLFGISLFQDADSSVDRIIQHVIVQAVLHGCTEILEWMLSNERATRDDMLDIWLGEQWQDEEIQEVMVPCLHLLYAAPDSISTPDAMTDWLTHHRASQ